MNHQDVTFDQYLTLVTRGEGKVSIVGVTSDKTRYARVVTGTYPIEVDPRQGVALIIAGETVENMPIKWDTVGVLRSGFLLSTDERQRMIFTGNEANFYKKMTRNDGRTLGIQRIMNTTVGGMIYSISAFLDSCLENGTPLVDCSTEVLSLDTRTFANAEYTYFWNFHDGKVTTPLFYLTP